MSRSSAGWGDPSEPTQDSRPRDEVVGRALRRSLWLLAAVGVGGLFTWLLIPPPEFPEGGPLQPVARRPRESPIAADAFPHAPFVDVAAAAGVDFQHINGATGRWLMPENIGGGCAIFDFDNDGWQDLLLVQSGYLPGTQSTGESCTRMGLYRNLGGGRFENFTDRAGMTIESYGMGCAIGDYDGDGARDVFISAVGRNHLFRNQGDGTFCDVTEQAGVSGDDRAWSTCAVFFDYDRDGWLDLYVGNYVDWSAEQDALLDHETQGVRGYLPPWRWAGTYGWLYRNQGDGQFRDVSAATRIRVNDAFTGRPAGKALGACAYDFDGDGYGELVVANDQVSSFLFHNQRDGSFREVGRDAGLGFDNDGLVMAGMGVDAGVLGDDGKLSIGMANIGGRATALYVPQAGPLQFVDRTKTLGTAVDTYDLTTWGLIFLDFDLDGRLDLFQSNGSVENQVQSELSRRPYLQPCQLFWNGGTEQKTLFAVMPDARVGGDLARPILGRGAACGDIDNDGDLDVLVATNGGAAHLFRNDQRTGHHWLRLDLRGRGGNAEAVGAKVDVFLSGRAIHRQVSPHRSYLSVCELPITIGLGGQDQVEKIEINWPGGRRQTLRNPSIDAVTVIHEPSAE